MFGYVRPVMDKLSEEDRDRFESVYCGLCYELGNRYGLLARCILNYDFTFLAILLSEQDMDCAEFRCACKGFCKRKRLLSAPALARTADESVILAYWKIQDEIADSGFWHAAAFRLLRLLFKRSYRKAARLQPAFARAVEENLTALRQLEQDRAPSLDRPADAFAKLLSATAEGCGSEEKQRVHAQMLYHLGRWIYLIDALDDLKEDAQKGKYNPLIYRFSLQNGVLDEDSRQRLIATMDHSVNMIASAFVLADYGVWTSLLENIIYFGLPGAGRLVLEGKWDAASGGAHCLPGRSKGEMSERTEGAT